MVPVGLGVDPVAERMVRFVSLDPVDISVVTFHGFQRDGERLLARKIEVQSGRRESSRRRCYPTIAERRQALRDYLADKGYADVFDRVRADLRRYLPETGVYQEVGRYGIGFQLTEPDDSQVSKTYFSLRARYVASDVYSVSILPQAIHWGGDALDRLREAVSLYDWTHGGQCLRFKSADEWDQVRSAVLEFVDAVVANRAGRADLGAH